MDTEDKKEQVKVSNAVTDLSEHRDDKSEKQKGRLRGIYLLPNLITTAALFSGFYSIISSMNGAIEKAAIAIVVSGLLDAMDGRIARLTNTQSEFGVQYDSLSDLVAFGVAPAVLLFSWTLSGLHNLGWMMAFIYMACTALRLARFNTHPETSSFTGLASPAAAAVVATLIWLSADIGYLKGSLGVEASVLVGILGVTLGVLMVSNITYYSPKGINLKGRVPFIYTLAIIMLFVVIFLDPPAILLSIACIYALSGPFQAIQRRRQAKVNEDL